MSSAKPPDGKPTEPVPLAEIELAEREGVRVVAVAGELDISNVGTLEDVTFDLPNDALGIVLDLSSATYIDSATLGLLFRLHRSLKRRGQALRVVCPPGSSARRVLELTGFERETPPEEDRDAAIAAIRRELPLAEG
jgi:anti-anti-sigma factor